MNSQLDRYIETNFHKALDENYIQVHYQPVIRTISRQLCSFEALARWNDPERGLLAPDQFIPTLERLHLIHLLDIRVIRLVCARMRCAIEAGETPVPVSVNLSRLDFSLCDIFSMVDGIVAQYQIPHDFLYIEITESIMAEREDMMRSIVDRFRAAGYQVWMDDFGSAYSSLNILKDFAFDEIKLDMRFLSSFNQRSRRILTSVIQMAKDIEIRTLAEGVETEEQFRFLRNIGCEKVQGYRFGPPMPYERALDHLRRTGIAIELPNERKYYDDIGRINLLSAVPFMTREERARLTTARQLNSIPLAIAEARGRHFSILFYNTAFEKTAKGTGIMPNISGIFAQELLGMPQPISMLPERVMNLMDSTRSGEEGRMYFISNDEYYEIQAKCIAQTKDAYSVLFRLSNLSKASEAAKTSQLDEGLRQVYTLFERITLLDVAADAITPLYVAIREDLVSGRTGIRALAEEYAERWIFPEDRADYLALMDLRDLDARIDRTGRPHVSKYLRTYVRHGQYAWKQYTLLRLRPGVFMSMIRNVHRDILAFGMDSPSEYRGQPADKVFSPESLWKNLVQSNIIRLFWKDRDRRFVGVSRDFLDYYGFDGEQDVRGKTDEDLGWHIRPDHYMHNEEHVIQEGIPTRNIPGQCISNGENRDILASKTPIYDENGEIRGLLGYFIDRELLTVNDSRGTETKRRDLLTGLLNSRGVSEESHAFEDEYLLRNADFIRMHVSIDDFKSLNQQYGFDFGDKALLALGRALKRAFGLTSAVGRYSGHEFVILHQLHEAETAASLRQRVKDIAASIQQIEGVPLTFYLSVGACMYSEVLDLQEQTKKADVRLLADHDEHVTPEILLARSSELFHLYDDLPISYSVYKVLQDEDGNVNDAVVFYANRVFEDRSGKPAAELLGRHTRDLFPKLDPGWYAKAARAALRDETVVDRMYYAPTDKEYYMTASPIIHSGYCCFTYQEMERLNRTVPAD